MRMRGLMKFQLISASGQTRNIERIGFCTTQWHLSNWETKFPSNRAQDNFITFLSHYFFWLAGESDFEIWFKKTPGQHFLSWEIQPNLHLNVLKRCLENVSKYKQQRFLPTYMGTAQHPCSGWGLPAQWLLSQYSHKMLEIMFTRCQHPFYPCPRSGDAPRTTVLS